MRESGKKNIFYSFSFLITVCGFLFVFADFFSLPLPFKSSLLKYSSVMLCFFFAIWIGFRNPLSAKDSAWLTAALFFTLAADAFLLFKILKPTEVGHSIGVSFFCLAHLCHRKRMGKTTKKWWWMLIPYSALWIAFFRYPNLPIGNILLIVMTALYAFLLFLNLMASYHVDWHKYNKRYLTAGMLFLVICDLCVIIYQVLLRLPNMRSPAWVIYLSWVFYLPSQYFLVLSSWNKEKINKM